MRKALLLLLLFAAAFAAEPKIIGGPFVVNVTQRSATLVWVVQTDEASIRPAAGGASKSAPSLHPEKTTFTGLQPGTRYEYTAAGVEAGKGSFQTAASPGAPYRFVVYGDTRTRHDVHRHVVETMLKHGMPDFAIQSGDLVENGDDPVLWPIYFDIEREFLRHTAFFPVPGNHERNSRNYFDFFQQDSPYFSFSWGNAHFVMIDSDIENVAPTPSARQTFWNEQTKWMEDDLAKNQGAEFRFVVAHHPPFTAVKRRQGDNPHMTALVPLLEKYHVTAGFFGHDHNYQHYLKNGIHYITSGGGGAPLYDVDMPPAGIMLKVISTENFVAIDVQGKTARLEAIDGDGKTIEKFELHGSSQAPSSPQTGQK